MPSSAQTTPYVNASRIFDPIKAWDTRGSYVFTMADSTNDVAPLQLIEGEGIITTNVLCWLRNLPCKSFSWECYTSTDISISGIGTMWLNGKLIVQPDLMPSHWKEFLFNSRFAHQFSAEVESELGTREFDEICMPFSIWGFDNYGHVLIDAIPRALAARHVFGDKLKFLARNDTPEWVFQMCSLMGIPKHSFELFNHRTEKVRLNRGVFPAFPRQNQCIHPFVSTLFDRYCLLHTTPSSQRRLFFTRKSLSERRKQDRNCLNEGIVCNIAESEFGFEIVQPEQFSWADQISLVKSSCVLAGLAGSALHTSILSGPQTSVASIGFNALAQAQISRLRGQRYAVMNSAIPTNGDYEVNLQDLRSLLSTVT